MTSDDLKAVLLLLGFSLKEPEGRKWHIVNTNSLVDIYCYQDDECAVSAVPTASYTTMSVNEVIPFLQEIGEIK